MKRVRAASNAVSRRSLVQAPAWLVVAVPLVALALLVAVEVAGGDRAVFLRLNALSDATGAGVWAQLDLLGDGLVCAVLLVPWMGKHPERVWAAFLGAIVMMVVLWIFKEFLSVPRPLAVFGADAITLIGPGHRRSAFPSGHAATVFVYAGAWILAERCPRWSLVLLGPAAAIGLSRVVVGVHWPSDVLAGALVGWVAAWLGLRWAARAREVLARSDRLLMGALLLSAAALFFIDHTGHTGVVWLQRWVAVLCLGWGIWIAVLASRERARDLPATQR